MATELMEKKTLTIEELEAQTAVELPERDTLATLVVTCLAVCVGSISFRDINVGVAANACVQVGAAVNVVAQALTALATQLGLTSQPVQLDCRVTGNQRQGG